MNYSFFILFVSSLALVAAKLPYGGISSELMEVDEDEHDLLSDDFINSINAMNTTWKVRLRIFSLPN